MEEQSPSDAASESEWEYEVDLDNKESFYITLDTSHNPNNVFKQKADKPANGAYARKGGTSIVGTAHADDDQLDSDIAGVDKATIQILDLPSRNPIISYGSQLYSCNWTQTIGTDLIFCQAPRHGEGTTHTTLQSKESQVSPLPTDPILQGNGWALLATTSTKLVGHACKAIPKEKSDTARYTEIARAKSMMKATPAISLPDLFPNEEEESETHRQGQTSSELTVENESSARPVTIPLGIAATYSKQAQGKFLERLIAAKQSRGEQDHVFIGQGRSYEDSWREKGDSDALADKSNNKAARGPAKRARVYEAVERQTRSNASKGPTPYPVALDSSRSKPQEFQGMATDAIGITSTKGSGDTRQAVPNAPSESLFDATGIPLPPKGTSLIPLQKVSHGDKMLKSIQHKTTSTNIPSRDSQSLINVPVSHSGDASNSSNDMAPVQDISDLQDDPQASAAYNATSDKNGNNTESNLERPVQSRPSQSDRQIAGNTVSKSNPTSGIVPSLQDGGRSADIQQPSYVSPYGEKHSSGSAMENVVTPTSMNAIIHDIPSQQIVNYGADSSSIISKPDSNTSETPVKTSGKRTWGGRRPRAGRPAKDLNSSGTNTTITSSLEDSNEPRGTKRKQHVASDYTNEGGGDGDDEEVSEGAPTEEHTRRGRPRSKWLATEDKEALSRTEVLAGGLFRDMVPESVVKGYGSNSRIGKKDDSG